MPRSSKDRMADARHTSPITPCLSHQHRIHCRSRIWKQRTFIRCSSATSSAEGASAASFLADAVKILTSSQQQTLADSHRRGIYFVIRFVCRELLELAATFQDD